jgi:hypothetical protein
MWFLNVVLPVVIGSYFVLNFKTLSPTSQRRGRNLYKIIMIPVIPHNPHLLLGDTSTDLWFYQGEYNQKVTATNKILHYHSISG